MSNIKKFLLVGVVQHVIVKLRYDVEAAVMLVTVRKVWHSLEHTGKLSSVSDDQVFGVSTRDTVVVVFHECWREWLMLMLLMSRPSFRLT